MTAPRAYRPLRPRSLAGQLALLVVAEVVLYSSYAGHEARFHWATHFLVGLSVAALGQSAYLLLRRRPGPALLGSVLVAHLWAMWPDLAFRWGSPHARWMDWAALGHVSVHHLPTGTRGWLVLALLAAGVYTLLLARWLAEQEVDDTPGPRSRRAA